MEWVVVVLATGCLLFALHIGVDYLRRRRAIAPKIQRLEAAREELQAKIQASKGELDERRGQLSPLKEELDQLERESQELQQQLQQERTRRKPDGPSQQPPE